MEQANGSWGQQIWDGVRQEFSDLPDVGSLTRLILRLCLAAVAGGFIGWERQRAGKDAGLRTHMLVAIAAALFVMVPEQEGASEADLSRVIQGVASGVGFLGIGMIIKADGGERVRGLTSAAGVWLTAGLGVAAGLGRAATALISTALALAVLSLVRHAENRVASDKGAVHAPPPGSSDTPS